MNVDWTIRLSDIILFVVTVILIPTGRLLVSTLLELRQQLYTMQLVIGTVTPSSGILGEMSQIRQEVSRQHDVLIEMRSRDHKEIT